MPELQFDAERHIYTIDRQVVPSVTQILEDVGIIDYRRIPDETRQMALERGSMVHLYCQVDDENDLAGEVDRVILPYLNAWRKFRADTGIVFDLIEHRGYNAKWGYAGTLDRTGKLNGMPVLLDIKTNQAPDWVKYQLAAYAEFFPHPRTLSRMAVELHKDESYRAVHVPVASHFEDFTHFQCALDVYRTKRVVNNDRRKAA